MPTYEYVCGACGHAFDELESISAAAQLTCPKCGKNTLRRGPGGGTRMIFKGSGFYLTDYKGTKKEGEKKPSPEKSSSEKETPPAEKKEPPPKKSEDK